MSDPEHKEEILKESAKPVEENTTVQETPAGEKEKTPTEPVNGKTENGNQKKRKMLLVVVGIVIIIVIVVISAYILSLSPVATKGDAVFVYYTESFENGTIISSNMNSTDPLVFTIGNSSIITGFQDAVTGMSVNEVKTVDIPYTNAYGAYDPGLVQTLNRTGPIATQSCTPRQDDQVYFPPPNSYRKGNVLNVTPTTITWDANNPLVGYNLTFTIRLADLQTPS
ncbi:MAG: FKBP-type peptidyl-prolyl cis-trans isomerase [Methanoregula sp.]